PPGSDNLSGATPDREDLTMDDTVPAPPTGVPGPDDPTAFALDVETIPAVVERAARLYGEREGLVDGDVRLSFAELADAVDTAARGLVAAGIEPGDRVAL